MNIFVRLLAVATLLLGGANAWAQWELDNGKSSINFLSIKNTSIAEIHSFSSLLGYIGADGQIQLSIDLGSVETNIPIRNERMRELLFSVVQFPTASVTADVDPKVLAEVAGGGTVTTELPVVLDLHGLQQELAVPVTVFSDGASLRVVTPRPVILRATEFDLGAGVEALREVAGLDSISTAVPVTVNLFFSHAQ